MSAHNKIPAPDSEQPKRFAFGVKAKRLIPGILRRYPEGRQQSAVMPLLTLAQQQNGGWLSRAAMDHVADLLDMPRMRVYEVATFYSMYNLRPVARQHVEVCTTTPCWLRGSAAIMDRCRQVLGIEVDGMSRDGAYSLAEVECLGACVNAPVVKINRDYYEDLTPNQIEAVLHGFDHGDPVDPGPQSERHASEPLNGLTSLKSKTRRRAADKINGRSG